MDFINLILEGFSNFFGIFSTGHNITGDNAWLLSGILNAGNDLIAAITSLGEFIGMVFAMLTGLAA